MAQFLYKVEIRDKSGNLLELLEKDIVDIFWTFDSPGGCGECEITLRREFDNFADIDIDYDIRISRIKSAVPLPLGTRFGASGIQFVTGGIALTGGEGKDELRWRGFIRSIEPSLQLSESVRLSCSGYSRYLEYIMIPAQNYASQDIEVAVKDIIDTYAAPKTLIQRTASLGNVEATAVSISAAGLTFDTSAWEAIKTLAEIGGNAEWGVTPDLEFYFKVRSATTKQTWIIGDRIKLYQHAKSTDDEVRKVYLRGANSFTATLTAAGPGPETNYEKERVVAVASVENAADATLWGTAYFARFQEVKNKARLVIGSADEWIENRDDQSMPPIGNLRVLGGQIFSIPGARFGSSGIKMPFRLGGSMGATHDQTYRVASVVYRPQGTTMGIEIDLGERRSSMADLFRAVEFKLSEIRQAAV